MKTSLLLCAAAAALAALATAAPARADVLENVVMNFQSGATFSGQLTFADDFSQLLAVNGLLSGGGYGSDPMTSIWNGSVNFSSGDGNYSNFLLDGTPDNYNNFILLAINSSDPTQLQFTTGASFAGDDNTVDYADAMVSGSIAVVSNVPEAPAWSMFGAGLISMLAALRMTRRDRRAPQRRAHAARFDPTSLQR